MKKHRSIKRESGLSMIEAAVILAVMVPLLYGGVGVMEYLHRVNSLKGILNRHARAISSRVWFTSSGNQAYFVKPLWYNDPEGTRYDYPWHERMTVFADKLESDVNEALGCQNCPTRYRIELRAMEVRINTDTGAATAIICDQTPDQNPAGHDCQGPFGDPDGAAKAEDNWYKRIRGDLPAGNFRFDQYLASLTTTGELPFRYAVPCALFGVNQSQYYGYTEIRDGGDPNKPINYVRQTVVFGLRIRMDLTDSIPGSALRKLLPASSGQLTISDYAVFMPRQEF
jgi:hypothetical protein